VAETERRTSSVELFWDLVFVFAVSQVTSALAALITGLLVMLCCIEGLWSPSAGISLREPAAVHRDAAPPPI
jgi:hypothetical protein